MRLLSLTVSGFRCYERFGPVPFHKLTVFIGPNDAGKTCLLDAIGLLLTNRAPEPRDYHRTPQGVESPTVEIIGEFELSATDTIPTAWRVSGRALLRFTRRFTANASTATVEGLVFSDPRWATFPQQPAPIQKELLGGIGIDPGANAPVRVAQYEGALSAGQIPRVVGNVEVPFAQLKEFLPSFERIAAAEYNTPDAMVQRTLRAVVESVVMPTDPTTGIRALRPDLGPAETAIRAALNEKVDAIKAALVRHHPGIVAVAVEPLLDFSRGVTAANLTIDCGGGARLVASFGEGMKKKLWMGLLDWDEASRRGIQDRPVLRVYDEPDVNLDYAAERHLYRGIVESISRQGSETQAVICTHSMTLVDRSPASSINLIGQAPDGSRFVSTLLETEGDVEAFLSEIGRNLGLSNSALFYERAFLLVEGDSENNALPIMYRHLYGRSMAEDGIVLVNLDSCAAWRPALSLIRANRAQCTLILLDADCLEPESSGRITEVRLRDVGFSQEFLESNCFYIGQKEFEDAFATADILAVLEQAWPKESGAPWVAQDVDDLRDPTKKFSEDLLKTVRRTAQRLVRQSVKKPEFARLLATHCTTEAQVPGKVKEVFARLRLIAGVAGGGVTGAV